MNLNAEPPQPPQPHRPSTSCDRHPDEHFTGFCPSCLCERLAVLDKSNSASTSRKPPPIPTTSTATAALKAIFKPSSNNSGAGGSSRPSFFPELRRTKSFSASKNEGLGFSGLFEPQRKSCDVRVRNTLWSLFYQDDDRKSSKKETRGANAEDEVVDSRNLASSSSVPCPVKEEEEEEEVEIESESDNEDEDKFRASEDPNLASNVNSHLNPIEHRVPEIVEEEIEEEEEEPEPEEEPETEPVLEIMHEEDMKPMKDHIDLDSQAKKPSGRDFKEIAGSFWSAASVFSKKWQKWREKQKLKKRRNDGGGGSATLPVEKPIGRQYRETQSEIADYGFGRRSCDTDPRFSLDAARISFDDPRYSFDEPRASWDGYLIGRNFAAASTRMPTMLSVVEDAPVVHVSRSDAQIPVEEHTTSSTNEDGSVPGGSMQTKEYYSDSSSRRRKSLDRSNSIRKTAAAVVAEMDEMKSLSNAKVTPAATADYLNGLKLPDVRDLNSNSNSLRDDCSETFEIGFRDSNASLSGNGERKGTKKSKRWTKAWNIWGFIHRRSINKDEDDDGYSKANGVERSLSESWKEMRGERNGEAKGGFNPRVLRSNSSVSWRNSNGIGGSFGNLRKNGVENMKKRKDEFVLERNGSARFSPNNIDNGMLRFYLTPMRGSRRAGIMKSRANHAHSIARSVLRLY